MGCSTCRYKACDLAALHAGNTREIQEYLKETDLEVHYADNYDKVFEAAFNSSSSC
jgi:hypothetical protein